MKYVSSGSGKMPLISLLAILSISLTINMPGLAVSPMLGKLHHVFNSSELESQLITSLPNMVMIPVVLIAGRLSVPRWQTAILSWGLAIFLVSGILSFFADSMTELIALGCMGGVGCGMVVPVAAGYISEWFVGKSRQADLGLKSTTSNAMVIVANLYVGWVITYNWHAAFAAYLIPLVPLCLVPFMTQRYIKAHRIENAPAATTATATTAAKADAPYHFQGKTSVKLLFGLIFLYMILTYCTTSISYYAPFLMDHFGMSTTAVGIVTAAYYATCALTGMLVSPLKRVYGRNTMIICLMMCAAGLLVIGTTHNVIVYIIASLVTGFGYGVIQPVIYNKTTYVAPSRALSTRYFGYLLASNYVAIMMVPFVDGFARKLFQSHAPGFEFLFSGIVVVLLLTWAIIMRRNYVFAVNPDSAAPTPAEVTASINE